MLETVMQTFRRKGYAASSYKELQKETGLRPGSLYNAFGGKEQLFGAALGHYKRAVVRRNLELFVESSEGLQGIENLFLAAPWEPLGCLLTNAAIEFGGGEKTTFDRSIRAGLRLLETGFRRQIERAQVSGHVSRAISSSELAARLLLEFQGLLVLSRLGWGKEKLQAIVEQLFEDVQARAGPPGP